MHHGNFVRGVRMRVALFRRAMRRPARMADADRTLQRFFFQLVFKIGQLALGTAARNVTVGKRGDARAVIAPVFKALQPLHKQGSSLFFTDDADYSAHFYHLFIEPQRFASHRHCERPSGAKQSSLFKNFWIASSPEPLCKWSGSSQ